MKIGLIDVDGHNYPNLALMKISAFHKAQGDSVSWYDPLISVDKVYASKVFTFTPDYQFLHCDNVEKGGSGYDLKNALCPEIEAIYPDYSLYNIKDTAYGFLTRGCPRRCPFCIVSKKEGVISKKVADLNDFWNGQKFIKLLDPNLLACNESLELLEQLKESRAYMVHFAWDNMSNGRLIIKNILWFMGMTGHRNNVSVYVLTNFNTTFEEDLERVYALRDIGVKPYIMIYNKEKLASLHKTRLLQRYVNNKLVFNSVKRFEEYDCMRG